MVLPTDFITQIRHILPAAEADALCEALSATTPPTSVRLNPLKRSGELPAAAQADVPWCTEGHYLVERPAFTFDPLLHAGCYYVQEAASMFVEQAYRTIAADFTPQRVLDLCAAPGGKSTLWRSLLPDGALLVANEPVRNRAQILAENLAKWGHPDVVCTSAYADSFAPLAGMFDVIAADVPCSGEGMFRKDEGAISEWSLEAVVACAERQWDIISTMWPALRAGGYLVYSTCTFNQQENELMVDRICRELGAEPVPIATKEDWGISGDTTESQLPVYHFFPHRTNSEGLFLALLRKTSGEPAATPKKKKDRKKRQPARGIKNGAKVAEWIENSSDFKLLETGEGYISAVRQSLADDVQSICAAVTALSAGILLACEKGGKLIPQHALALSTQLRREAFPSTELSLDEALSYLRRESLTLSADLPRGYVLVCYHGFPLGFVNNLGARANNLYPQEWRIRSEVRNRQNTNETA